MLFYMSKLANIFCRYNCILNEIVKEKEVHFAAMNHSPM